MDEVAVLRRLDRLIWAMIAAVAAIVLAAPAVSQFQIAWSTFAVPTLACGLLVATGSVYRFWRIEPRFASGLDCTAQVIAFAAVGAPLSYLAASTALPLQDHIIDAADHLLGLDWKALSAWMNAHPALHQVFSAAYLSFQPQATVTVLALALTARFLQLRIFMLSFVLTTLVTIAISAFLPVQGVLGHYGLSASDYPAIVRPLGETNLTIFYGLRTGSLHVLRGLGSEGIISFPSLHAALGVIFISALWPVRVLRWISLAVNSLLIFSTPIDGGHYFLDVFAGIAIALLCQVAARAIATVPRSNAYPHQACALGSLST
jgi:membrane-associated phospholipid phosphatase